MTTTDIVKPKTHKGKKALENKAPKIVENDKRTLVLKGGHTSQLVNDFLNDLCALKTPLVCRLKWRNPVLPFEDISFVEKMCRKYDCSMFVIGLHSKKRPHNIVFGRLHDGELLDMFELGIKTYKGLLGTNISPGITGAKPMLLFSGEIFEQDRQHTILKSLLVDLFRGPVVEKIRTIGLEHQVHFSMLSDKMLSMHVRHIHLKPITKQTESDCDPEKVVKPIRAPWGALFKLELEDSGPLVDFELRRVTLPSEDKWKRAHRVPPETRMAQKKTKNRQIDVFGSHVGRVHVGKKETLDELRPAASLRTALTGHTKRGFERHKKTSKAEDMAANDEPPKKRVKA